MNGSGNTTVPGDPSTRGASASCDDTVLGLVICHSVPEPGREGEVALFDPRGRDVAWIVGREVEGGPERVHFFQQRPGELIDCGALRGKGISQEQLRIRVEGDGLRVHNVGSAHLFVDGCEVPHGHSVVVKPGAVLEIFDHTVFVVERRPRRIEHPHRLLLPLQPFGEPCSMGFAGESAPLWALRDDIAYVANSQLNVLVLGETGTGKEVTANAIHSKSERAKGPFVAPNCAEVTAELKAASFFGTRKNWPNPGTPETNGYFGDAAGGDLFLDEIGCMEKTLQSTLLRALENGFSRVGESRVQRLQCKVTAATNKGDDSLAEDVLMRFGYVIRLLPLRERRSDIAAIVRHLLLARARKDAEFEKAFVRYDATGRPYVLVDPTLMVNLLRHPLPGNVRQVGIILESAVRASGNTAPLRWPEKVPAPPAATLVMVKEEERHEVSVDDLARGLDRRIRKEAELERAKRDSENPPGDKALPSKDRILEELDRRRWHYGETAKAFRITEHQLYRLRQKYGIP